jgi:hypothetical protein
MGWAAHRWRPQDIARGDYAQVDFMTVGCHANGRHGRDFSHLSQCSQTTGLYALSSLTRPIFGTGMAAGNRPWLALELACP